MTARHLQRRCWALLTLVALGCGEDRATFSPGVSGNRPWRDLSAKEAMTVCANTRAFLKERLELARA